MGGRHGWTIAELLVERRHLKRDKANLLEALREVLKTHYYTTDPASLRIHNEARKAIAKAEKE